MYLTLYAVIVFLRFVYRNGSENKDNALFTGI